MKRILLIEPNFPIPPKSRNHKNFLPIGLLKIASYLKAKNHEIKLIRDTSNDLSEELNIKSFDPEEIWITSLFTYWSQYVKDTINKYKIVFPKAKIVVGGIYASLMPEHCKTFTNCDKVHVGILKEAEYFSPAYELLENSNPYKLDYQIIHASRGCNRRCSFCGTWKIELNFISKKSIKNEVKYKNIVFYDNNFLANPYIKNILEELIELKTNNKILWCESQSGFDGRILLKSPELAIMLKKAGFRYPRIAWDWKYNEYPIVKEQINILKSAGYRSKDISIFMLYNWNISYEEMEKKRIKCWDWKVQIVDCRFRPLNQTFDYYQPKKRQTKSEYFIHPIWTDERIKQYRKNVRRQNICVRQDVLFYSKQIELKKINRELTQRLKRMNEDDAKIFLDDIWFPNNLGEYITSDIIV